nr:unnamed protein product [Callosobruchus chinensis]
MLRPKEYCLEYSLVSGKDIVPLLYY